MTGSGSYPPLVRFLAAAGCAAGVVWFVLVADERLTQPLTAVLCAYVTVANLLAVRCRGPLWVSASFTFSMLAVVTLGPAAAFAVVAVGELTTWTLERYRPTAAAINVAGAGLPNLVAGTLFEALAPAREDGLAFTAFVLLIAALALALNYVLVGVMTAAAEDGRLHPPRRLPGRLVVPLLLNLGLTVAFATLADRSAMVVVCMGILLAGVATREMIALTLAGQRARDQRADLSVRFVDGLVRSLAERDPGAARHAAAVARYSRDIALATGMDRPTCEAAHTAGLLHDVGLIALPDHAIERQGLAKEDWELIRRHPDLGATMISGLGPVADAVRCHHERIDGRGYPRGLRTSEIPVLAKIVSVAEVYDTLTRRDGAAKSSFEALRELRRVAGTQLDDAFVEALAATLAGRSADDRQGVLATVEEALAEHRRTAAADEAPALARLRPSLAPPSGTK
jgi:HD domain